jgi:hypothetical protein
MIALLAILVTGFINIVVKIKHSSSANLGRKQWLWIHAAKFIILVFLTPVTDFIAIRWSGPTGQTTLDDTQLYVVRSLKFVLVLIAFTLGLYARIYREDVTNQFSSICRPAAKKEGVKE